MSSVVAWNLAGGSVTLDNCRTVGSVMAQIGHIAKRIAAYVVIISLDSGEQLAPGAHPPAEVHVIIKPDDDSLSAAELLLSVRLHASEGDVPLCAKALQLYRQARGAVSVATSEENTPTMTPQQRVSFFSGCRSGCGCGEVEHMLQDTALTMTLLRAGVSARGHRGTSALRVFAERGETELVRALIENGAHVNAADRDGETALAKASIMGHSDTVELLISSGATVNHTTMRCGPPLLEAAFEGDVEMVKLLLTHGACVNLPDRFGMSALVNASLAGHKDVVELLLARGARINHASEDGETALAMASFTGRKDVVEVLLASGADPLTHLKEDTS